MNPWKIILATLVIFGAGVVTGGLLVNYTSRAGAKSVVKVSSQPLVNPWQLRNRELVRRMERELDLDPDQRGRVEKLVQDSQERTKNLWKPIVPQMNREMQQLHAQIRAELTPTQQKKFDELVKPHSVKKGDESKPRRSTNSSSLSPESPAGIVVPVGTSAPAGSP